MKFVEIAGFLEGIPHMSKNQGSILYKMILEKDIENILELGTAHGTGSCYMAAALHEKGKGSVLTIDNKQALERKPNAKELINTCGLQEYATPLYANTSYNWELMKLIEKQTKNGICEPIFDFCYLDGAHNFEIDCCAFLLVDKLLKPGGSILFDDLNWSYVNSPSLKSTDWVNQMEEDEKNTPHIRKLVELIVINHNSYSDFNYFGDWFLIKKKSIGENDNRKVAKLEDYMTVKGETSISTDVKNLLKKIKIRFLN